MRASTCARAAKSGASTPCPGRASGHETWADGAGAADGVNVWSSMSVDETRGLVFPPVGPPRTTSTAATGRAARCSRTRLCARRATGARRWRQLVHHDLGLRSACAADPRGHHAKRLDRTGGHPADEDGPCLRPQSRDRGACVRGRGASGAWQFDRRRVSRADAAVPAEAAAAFQNRRSDARRSHERHRRLASGARSSTV